MRSPKIIVEKNEKRHPWVVIGVLIIFVFIVANIILRYSISENRNKLSIAQKQMVTKSTPSIYTQEIKLETKCPDEQSGNPNAFLIIKYFYSPVCFWCILEDRYLDELLQKDGQAFKLEKYNRENCENIMQKYKLSLTPSFVFSTKNASQEYTVDGYISKENLIKVICDVTGYCLKDEKKSNDEVIQKGKKIKIEFK